MCLLSVLNMGFYITCKPKFKRAVKKTVDATEVENKIAIDEPMLSLCFQFNQRIVIRFARYQLVFL